MPRLLSLKGQLTKVTLLLKLLTQSTNPSIKGELLASNMSLTTMIHKIVDALVICNSDLSIVVNFTSTSENGPSTKTQPFPAKTLRKWRECPNQLAHLTRLRLVVSGLEDSVLQVIFNLYRILNCSDHENHAQSHCKRILSVFPGLCHVTLRRDSDRSGWEWARITWDDSTGIAWDCLKGSDYLESSDHRHILLD